MSSVLTTTLPRQSVAEVLPRLVAHTVLHLSNHLRNRKNLAQLELSDIAIPDSSLALQATEFAAAVSPAFLFNHAIRSYLFAAALGERDQLKVDREVLFVACVLHDLGLTKKFDGGGAFQVEGAIAARRFLIEHYVPEERADLVHEAIALHSSLGIGYTTQPEIALVQRGAAVDVFGLGFRGVHPVTRGQILAEYPRLNFKTCFDAVLRDQARRKPDTLVAGDMSRWRGFDKLVALAPFDE